MSALQPIVTAHLFPKVAGELHGLLEGLSPEEWNAVSANGRWIVRDLAAHLLDSSLRRVSAHRDRHVARTARSNFASYDDLLGYLNWQNAEWIAAAQRLSPAVLLDLLRHADRNLAEFFAQEDPDAPALWPVAWAGEEASKNGFDIAREYTEKWHHTQQLFEITGRASTIVTRELMLPVLDTFFRALPHALRDAAASEGAVLQVAVRGVFDADWWVERRADCWALVDAAEGPPAAGLRCGPLTAWRICTTRGADPEAFADLELIGDRALAAQILDIVAVMI